LEAIPNLDTTGHHGQGHDDHTATETGQGADEASPDRPEGDHRHEFQDGHIASPDFSERPQINRTRRTRHGPLAEMSAATF
jgi:hypothetical protein